MPAATIGLFALAIAIVALAFIIQRVLSDGGDGDLPPADVFATQSAVQTQTAAAGGGQTPVPTGETPDGDTTPGNDQTPTDGETATPGGGETPGGGTTTYTVQAGDFCGTIAAEFGITVEQLIEANDLDAECAIFPNQELIIPQ
jgi:LysM repeat protein